MQMTMLRDLAAIANDAVSICSTLLEHKVVDKAFMLRAEALKLSIKVGVVMAALLLMIVGFVFLLWGVYVLLAEVLNPGISAIIVGVIIVLVGLLMFMAAKKTAH